MESQKKRGVITPKDLILTTGSPPSVSTVIPNPVISDGLFIDEVRVPMAQMSSKGPPSEYRHTRDQVFNLGASGKRLRSKP